MRELRDRRALHKQRLYSAAVPVKKREFGSRSTVFGCAELGLDHIGAQWRTLVQLPGAPRGEARTGRGRDPPFEPQVGVAFLVQAL